MTHSLPFSCQEFGDSGMGRCFLGHHGSERLYALKITKLINHDSYDFWLIFQSIHSVNFMVVLSKVDFDTRWAQIVYSEPNGGEAENCGGVSLR